MKAKFETHFSLRENVFSIAPVMDFLFVYDDATFEGVEVEVVGVGGKVVFVKVVIKLVKISFIFFVEAAVLEIEAEAASGR